MSCVGLNICEKGGNFINLFLECIVKDNERKCITNTTKQMDIEEMNYDISYSLVIGSSLVLVITIGIIIAIRYKMNANMYY